VDCEELSQLDDDLPRTESLFDVLTSYEPKDTWKLPHYERHDRLSEWGTESSGSETRRYKYDGSSVVWIASNSKEFSKLYAGQWILVDKSLLIAHSLNPSEQQEIARKRGIPAPMILKVSASPRVPSRRVYAGQIVRDNYTVR